MAGEEDEVHRETDEARGGSTPHIVRWVLGVSLVAAIVLLSAIWMIGALSQDEIEAEVTATGIAEERQDEGSDTDGIVLEDADEFAPQDDTGPLNIPNEAGQAADDAEPAAAQ